MKKMKKINYDIELLCIIRSFLLNDLISLLHQRDCMSHGKAFTIQESNTHSTISVTISSPPLFSCTNIGNLTVHAN